MPMLPFFTIKQGREAVHELCVDQQQPGHTHGEQEDGGPP